MNRKNGAIVRGQRVYEYTDQDGNLFWSFDKLPSVSTPGRILRLQDRVGTHFDNFVSEIRALRRLLIEDETDEMLDRG